MKKAFTLFSALVGVLLIVISVLLAESMSNTERSASEIIVEARLDQEMIDAALFAQQDSLQGFNFGIRTAIEEYFRDHTSNYFTFRSGSWNNSIEDISQKFQEEHFGSNNQSFANFAARNILLNLQGVKRTPEFLIRLNQQEEGRFRELLLKVFNDSGEDLFEVIGCDDSECDKGTFYLNLDFGALTDKEYEELPKIEVIKKSTCIVPEGTTEITDDALLSACKKKIQIPIVPKTKIRIFVPLRIFKGIFIAKEIANNLFDSHTMERLNKVKLGVCDSKRVIQTCPVETPEGLVYQTSCVEWFSCAPRADFETMVSDTDIFGKVCIGHNAATNLQMHEVNLLNGQTYNPNPNDSPLDLSTTREAMRKHVFEEILQTRIANYLSGNPPENDFILAVDEPSGNYFSSASITPASFPSRNVSPSGNSTCYKIESVEADLVFEERNPRYTISPDSSENFRFAVRLKKEGFSGFGPPNENEKSGYTCTSIVDGPAAFCRGFVPAEGCVIDLERECPAG